MFILYKERGQGCFFLKFFEKNINFSQRFMNYIIITGATRGLGREILNQCLVKKTEYTRYILTASSASEVELGELAREMVNVCLDSVCLTLSKMDTENTVNHPTHLNRNTREYTSKQTLLISNHWTPRFSLTTQI